MFDLFSLPNHELQHAVLPVDAVFPIDNTQQIVYGADNYPPPKPK
jgi:hypothetical protein